ncbi:hypothetical protein DFH11DRAFT_1722744 [Phellopilus nigrolimitatus]|nr:hypothetical protein DFH11DRAFT_1722744 [Phellopilus nigrolimitatus]
MTERGEWQTDVQYNQGDIVEFAGMSIPILKYKIIQPHRSQSDWAPRETPALWEGLGSVSGGGGGYQPSYQQPQDQKQQPEQPPQQWQNAPQAPDSGYTADNGAKVDKHDGEKKWYDLDDKKKQELVAGGLIVGLGALAGGAYYAHGKHKKGGEEEKAQAFELQNWMVAARQRTDDYLRSGPRSPTTWIYSEYLSDNPGLRNSLLPGGEEHGKTWYIARAPHIGGLQPGKCRHDVGAYFGFGHEAIHVRQYEVLVGDPRGVRWVPMSGRFSFEKLGATAVEGGREDDGTPLAIARGHGKEHQGLFGIGGGGKEGIYPGKASPKLDGAYVTAGDKEVKVENYEVLVYA